MVEIINAKQLMADAEREGRRQAQEAGPDLLASKAGLHALRARVSDWAARLADAKKATVSCSTEELDIIGFTAFTHELSKRQVEFNS
jgi:hypothetical protein